jgi:N-methylhydantoinase B
VVQLSDGTDYPAKARFHVPEGQTVKLAFPGGGGMGAPSHRDLQAVARDVRLGYVSEEAAKRDYGWEP